MEDRIVIVKLTPTGEVPEINIYQKMQDMLNRMEDAKWVEHGATVETVLSEVPATRLHP